MDFIERMLNEKIAVNCKTIEEARILLEIFRNYGIDFVDRVESLQRVYGDRTCYRIYNSFGYSPVDYYMYHCTGWRIVEFSEIFSERYGG